MAVQAILFIALVFVAAAIPLHLAARMFGGDSTLLKAILTNLIAGVLGGVISLLFSRTGLLVYFIVLLLVYKMMFKIGWIKAFLVWLLQGIILFVFLILFGLIGILVL